MIDTNFELKELAILGEGGFGRVLKCFDKKSWRFYALKIQVREKKYLAELINEVSVQ